MNEFINNMSPCNSIIRTKGKFLGWKKLGFFLSDWLRALWVQAITHEYHAIHLSLEDIHIKFWLFNSSIALLSTHHMIFALNPCYSASISCYSPTINWYSPKVHAIPQDHHTINRSLDDIHPKSILFHSIIMLFSCHCMLFSPKLWPFHRNITLFPCHYVIFTLSTGCSIGILCYSPTIR